MSEILNTSIETQTSTKIELPGLSLEKQELLKKQENSQIFFAIMKSSLITPEEKQKVLFILNNSPKHKLEIYFQLEGFNLIDKAGIKHFINSPEFAMEAEQYLAEKEEKLTQEKTKNTERWRIEFIKKYLEVRNIFLELSRDDQDLRKIVIKLDTIKNGDETVDLKKTVDELAAYLSKNQNITKIFSKLSNNPKSYVNLYNFLENLENPIISQILQTIPKDPEEFKNGEKRAKKILQSNPYFPGIKKSDIKTFGNLIIASIDSKNPEILKIVDTKTLPPYSFIKGPNGYKIETKIVSQDILNIRRAYTKEKIRICKEISQKQNELQNLENFYNTNFQNIKDIEKELQFLKQKNPKDIQDDIKILELEEVILKQQELSKKINDLKTNIEKLHQELKTREDEFIKYYNQQIYNQKDNIKQNDEKAKETLSILESIGFTHIPYYDFLKIQSIINTSPQKYGFSKPIDLNAGFDYNNNTTKINLNEFINFWNKLIGKEYEINIGTVQNGNLGDTYKKENFKIELKQRGVLNEFGGLNIDYFNSVFDK